MTDEQTVERVARCRVAKAIIADHLQLLNDFDIDADIYNSDPECIDGAYATADFILAAMQPALAEAEARGRGKGILAALAIADEETENLFSKMADAEKYGDFGSAEFFRGQGGATSRIHANILAYMKCVTAKDLAGKDTP